MNRDQFARGAHQQDDGDAGEHTGDEEEEGGVLKHG